MKMTSKSLILLALVLLVTLPLMVACGDDDETAEPTATTTPTETPKKDVNIKIGLLTDMTGPAAAALIPVDQGLKDVVRYFNENDLIPGANLEIISYDTQYDPSKDIPGYEFLSDKKVSFFYAGVPSAPITNKPRIDSDKKVFFSLTAAEPMYNPPGYTFSINIPADAFVYTMLDWLANNDPNFPTDRPAKIGAVGAEGPYAEVLQGGIKAYCNAHPDQYEWVAGFLLSWQAVDFGTEVEVLRNCDYVMPPSTGTDIPGFMKQYRDNGGKGRFLGTDAQLAYLGFLVQGAGYDVMDGMLFALPYTWWNEDAPVCNLAKQLLSEYHPAGEAAQLKESGGAYRGGFTQGYGTISIVAEAINKVGPENFNSQVLYETCVGYKTSIDGNSWEYSDDPEASPAEQRTSWSGLGMFELDAELEDLVRISDGWTSVVMTP